jgi:hypothetical protein
MGTATTGQPAWTDPAGLVRTLRRRWETGVFLTRYALGQPWEPLGISLRGPAAGELAASFGDVQAWVRQWEKVSGRLIRLEHKRIGGRTIGANSIPCRAWIDSYRQLWTLLGVEPDVRRFTAAVDQARTMTPSLTDWVTAHPVRVLSLAHDWEMILGTVRWIDLYGRPGSYLRQIDVPGVDTKFIERHRGILTDLLDLQLAAERIDHARPRSDFAGRYRFGKKPGYVRFRHLGVRTEDGRAPATAGVSGPNEFTEIMVRADELAAAPPGISVVYVVENEITYLAFPPVQNAIVIFGGGYAASALESLPWLADRELFYWGDIDTHGFSILSRLRRRFPRVRSLLMDRETLLAHESQWVTEPSPAVADQDYLQAAEADLYHDLLTGALGPSVRLEQERVRFLAIEQALAPLLARQR